ncbi:ParB/RepB/Spo0J family partition protein [Planctomycetota bacterium]
MSTSKKEKPKHLGRGLQSLLGPVTPLVNRPAPPIQITSIDSNILQSKNLQPSMKEINLSDISPNPYQPRTVWDGDDLTELADSIKANGVIQPIIVRPKGSGYELIAGERRLRAAQIASLETIPALVRSATDEQLLELALIENIHRTDLNPLERAAAYQSYISTFSLTQAQAAERLGESRSVIANHLRLLELPKQIKQMLTDGQLTMGHARAILSLPDDELRNKLANRAIVGRLSVRDVERLVRQYLEHTTPESPSVTEKPVHVTDLERKLAAHLGTKVSIDVRKNGQRGKVVIHFYSLDEFDRITEAVGLNPTEEL